MTNNLTTSLQFCAPRRSSGRAAASRWPWSTKGKVRPDFSRGGRRHLQRAGGGIHRRHGRGGGGGGRGRHGRCGIQVPLHSSDLGIFFPFYGCSLSLSLHDFPFPYSSFATCSGRLHFYSIHAPMGSIRNSTRTLLEIPHELCSDTNSAPSSTRTRLNPRAHGISDKNFALIVRHK